MSSPFDLGSVLVGAPEYTPLRVRSIPFDEVRARCADRGVFVGDEISCLGATRRHVLLQLPTGSFAMIELPLAACIEVDSLESGRVCAV